MKTRIFLLFLFVLLVANLLPQRQLERELSNSKNPDELVSLSETIPFNEAIALLSKISESTTGKQIISRANLNSPIGIEIANMLYDKALSIIVKYNGLIYEETENSIIVLKPGGTASIIKKDEAADYASLDAREVKISAVFFELDVNEAKNLGLDWKLILAGNGVSINSELITSGKSAEDEASSTGNLFNIKSAADFNVGNLYGRATALFNTFESNGLGEVIASPNIVVRNKQQGNIQVGADFSILTKDFAGNTIEKFYPTGTMITVTPTVLEEDGISYILLDLQVERSSFLGGATSTQVKKTTAQTKVLSLNGEENVIGGLFTNEEAYSRSGIPILKDLPWWFFGIRYLTGSDSKTISKKELVILYKVELLPTLRERFNDPIVNKELIKKERDLHNERLENFRLKSGAEEKTQDFK